MIPYGRQDVTPEDVAEVVKVLQSDFLTQGPAVPLFEETVSSYCGAAHAVAVNSATSALHLACRALGLSEGDWLWTSPITFVASANCGIYCGASVDFVDIDPKTYTMCPVALEAKLRKAQAEGKLPKIVIPVHLAGQSCDMQAIHALSQRYGFAIVEDASHAVGADYLGQRVGSCQFSDVVVFSFHPVKIVTTGEGGLALTNNPKLAEQMSLLRSHGITRDTRLMTDSPDGSWYYQQIDLGFNYRMTDMQAALGVSQFGRLGGYIARRREIAETYTSAFCRCPLQTPWQSPDGHSAWHLYIIRLRLDEIAKSHREVFETMRNKGIGVNLHYIPVHTQPYYRQVKDAYDPMPEAERYYAEAISLPMFPTLTPEQQSKVIDVVLETVQ